MEKKISPGSESEFPVGDWQKLEGMNTLFLGTAKEQMSTALSIQITVYTTSKRTKGNQRTA